MKKLVGILCLTLLVQISFAEPPPFIPPKPTLDKIGFQVSARQWVKTQSALIQININATLSNSNLVKARGEIMSDLKKIAQGDWHLVSFNRSQDSSGLEKLSVDASARVDQSQLTNIYKNAKSVSKPGLNYEVGSIEFKPSLEEIQKAKEQLRERLYQMVNEELARINKQYNSQAYSVFRVFFTEGDEVVPQKAYKSREMMNTMVMQGAAPQAMTVSNELTMSAIAEVASDRK